jgi:predicted N-acetyltransferase YhbS
MRIRTATPADLPRVMASVRATVEAMRVYGNDQWDDRHPDEARFRRDVDAVSLFVAERDGQLIGFITFDQDEPEGYASLAWNSDRQAAIVIHRFAVAPKSQMAGVASALERHACELARRRGLGHSKVDTQSSKACRRSWRPRATRLSARRNSAARTSRSTATRSCSAMTRREL